MTTFTSAFAQDQAASSPSEPGSETPVETNAFQQCLEERFPEVLRTSEIARSTRDPELRITPRDEGASGGSGGGTGGGGSWGDG